MCVFFLLKFALCETETYICTCWLLLLMRVENVHRVLCHGQNEMYQIDEFTETTPWKQTHTHISTNTLISRSETLLAVCHIDLCNGHEIENEMVFIPMCIRMNFSYHKQWYCLWVVEVPCRVRHTLFFNDNLVCFYKVYMQWKQHTKTKQHQQQHQQCATSEKSIFNTIVCRLKIVSLASFCQ